MINNFEIKADFSLYKSAFLEENFKHNLISKNDEKYLWEKHIYDSLAIKLFFEKYDIQKANILDIGCGGGFPCLPIAIECQSMHVTGVDSIKKKILSVQEIAQKLNLDNIELVCDRVENLKNCKFDLVVSRAVADLEKISKYALPLLKAGGYFIAYKSKKALEELEKAQSVLKAQGAELVEIIEYTLPLEEIYERNLVCIRKL